MLYDSRVIRELLIEAYNDEALTALCFDYFRPVYQRFTLGMTKFQKVQLLLEYTSQQSGRQDSLLQLVQKDYPEKFSEYSPQLQVLQSSLLDEKMEELPRQPPRSVTLVGLGVTVLACVAVLLFVPGVREFFTTPTPALGVGSTATREKGGAVMVYVPAGEFTMGSESGDSDEKPVHKVYLDAFWVDKTEATNAQYEKCVAAGECKASGYANNADFNGDMQPVVGVDWNDAKTYCEWAGGRLPTEAEWEKAARGTDERTYPWGSEWDAMRVNSEEQGPKTMTAVGSYPAGASPYGALDMAGNVWEWVADWYDEGYYSRSREHNPTGPDSGQYRVLRGGSWYDTQNNVRSANRLGNTPDYWKSLGKTLFWNNCWGFRCTRS